MVHLRLGLGKMKLMIIESLLSLFLFFLLFHYILKAVLILSIVVSVILSVMSYAMSPSTSTTSDDNYLSLEETLTTDNVDLTADTTPSVYVNENLLKISRAASCENNYRFNKAYKIQEVIFFDDYKQNFSNCNKLLEFELERIECEDHCSDNDEEEFSVSQRELKSGYIFNSHIYLTRQQWHTIISITEDLLSCVVCGVYMEPHSMEEHIEMALHKKQLLKHKPLRRFEFSITRKIEDFYHCGVCNIVYPTSEEYHHSNDYIHGDNKITSINQASDILSDIEEFDIPNDFHDFYHGEDYRNGHASPVSLTNHYNVKTTVGKNANNVIKLTSNSVCPKKIESQNKFNDTTIRTESPSKLNTDNKFKNANDKHLNTISNIINMDDKLMNIQVVVKKTQFVIDVFAYNSIVFFGYTKYCFVCDISLYDIGVCAHINDISHTNHMSKHNFLDNYSKHLIRQNGYKYHCGVCNVVVKHTHLKDHIDWATHQKLSIQSKTMKSAIKSSKIKTINVATVRETKVPTLNAPKAKILMHIEIITRPSQTKDHVFNNLDFSIDFFHWNGLCKLENGFRCVLCGLNVTDDVIKHCSDKHSEAILNNVDTKYFPAVIRKVNDKQVHCIACNKLLTNDVKIIREHSNSRKHFKNHNNIIKE